MNTISRQDEAIVLNNELQEIDNAMADLTRKRADVCFRINRVCAATSILAPEILATVFQHVCTFPCEFNIHDPHHPIILASVSRQWRQVVHTTPSLWTSFGIYFWDSEYASTNALTILQTYFEKSASLTVSLRLRLPKIERREHDILPDEDISQLPPPLPRRRADPRRPGLHDVRTQDIFKFIALQYPTKLRALFVDDIPPSWLIVYIWGSPYDSLDNFQAPNLERIHIGMPDIRPVDWPSSRRIPSSTVPRLRHLSLGQGMPLGLEFPYQHLTTLEVDDIPISDCLRVIRSCTDVVNCYCRCPRPPPANCPNPSLQPITLHHVKTFGWTFGFQKWDEALLQFITLPALEVFRCEDQSSRSAIGLDGNSEYDEQRWRNLQSTFLHQSPKLRVFMCLAMEPLHWKIPILASILPQTIQELHLRYVNTSIANDFMRALTPKPESWNEPVPFPSLKYLNIELENIYWIQDLVLDLVRARRSGDLQAAGLKTCLERLDLRRGRMGRTGGQMDIAQHLSAGFQEFVDQGFFLVTAVRNAGHTKWSRTPRTSAP